MSVQMMSQVYLHQLERGSLCLGQMQQHRYYLHSIHKEHIPQCFSKCLGCLLKSYRF